jgi:hypothetical protein
VLTYLGGCPVLKVPSTIIHWGTSILSQKWCINFSMWGTLLQLDMFCKNARSLSSDERIQELMQNLPALAWMRCRSQQLCENCLKVVGMLWLICGNFAGKAWES